MTLPGGGRRSADGPAWRLEALALLLLTTVAAALRLPGIAARGSWDADQGHDMLVLDAWVHHGVIPLLGPPTSIGDVHHGALYYYLLGPAAWLSGADPTAVVTELAIIGILAVVATWWLARSLAGPLAGILAGAVLAISPAAIEESTFIWNPNPIPLFAALALGSAWRARRTGRAAWWAASLAATGVVMQLHVLGAVLLPPILALALLEWRRTGGTDRRSLARGVLAGLGLVALGFLPLVVHELGHDFSETRRAVAYLASERPAPALDPVSRFAFILFRAIGWPLAGLVTSSVTSAIAAVSAVAVLVGWLAVTSRRELRVAVRWLVGTLAWSALALTFLAPSLATVTPYLPNDHYHAFLDPVTVALLAVAAAALIRRVAARAGAVPGANPRATPAATAILGALLLAAVAWIAVPAWPPAIAGDGGWPAALSAGERTVADLDGAGAGASAPVGLLGLPTFKGPDAIGYPLVRLGRATVDLRDAPAPGGSIAVVPCDRVFEQVMGAACGGPAEDAAVAALGGATGSPGAPAASAAPSLVARFDLSPRTSVSIYRVGATAR